MASLSKEEYLKRYLSGPTGESAKIKARRKKSKGLSSKSKSKNGVAKVNQLFYTSSLFFELVYRVTRGFNFFSMRIIDDELDCLPDNEIKKVIPEVQPEEEEGYSPVIAVVDKTTAEELALVGKFNRDAFKSIDDDSSDDQSRIRSSNKNSINNRSRRRHDSSASSSNDSSPPPARNKKNQSKSATTNSNNQGRRKRHDSSSESDAPSKSSTDSDMDVRRKNKSSSAAQPDDDDEQSPPRKKATTLVKEEPQSSDADSDLDVRRRVQPPTSSTGNNTKPIKSEPQSDDSDLDVKRPSTSAPSGKPSKTLSGASAGLQSAKDLRREAKTIKDREKKTFDQFDANATGENAATVFREKGGTGKRRDIGKEKAEAEAKAKWEEEMREKYSKWNRGTKQVKDRQAKMEELAAEAAKPLARYRNDVDLDSHLKEIDRGEDPMLAYVTKKKERESKVAKFPRYSGPAPKPNRFGIWPGYRWDGVDRSTGFEEKIQRRINNQSAQNDEFYRWQSGTHE